MVGSKHYVYTKMLMSLRQSLYHLCSIAIMILLLLRFLMILTFNNSERCVKKSNLMTSIWYLYLYESIVYINYIVFVALVLFVAVTADS